MSNAGRAKRIENLLKEKRVHIRWVSDRHMGTKLGTAVICYGLDNEDRYGKEAMRITGWEHGELLKAGKIKYIRLGCYGTNNG